MIFKCFLVQDYLETEAFSSVLHGDAAGAGGLEDPVPARLRPLNPWSTLEEVPLVKHLEDKLAKFNITHDPLDKVIEGLQKVVDITNMANHADPNANTDPHPGSEQPPAPPSTTVAPGKEASEKPVSEDASFAKKNKKNAKK